METSITLEFADGQYEFRLGLAQIHEIERKCSAGISEVFSRVMAGTLQEDDGQILLSPMQSKFYASDLIESIRQGLIGGKSGMVDGEPVQVTPGMAAKLIKAYVEDQPLMHSWELACAILGSSMIGYEPPGKKSSVATEGKTQETEQSDSTTD